MKGSRPAASVVIPARNARGWIEQQLASLAAQEGDVPGFEVVVADNGSVDGTVESCQSWMDRLDLRVVDASGVRGAGAVRNTGAEGARSSYLLFCDADDVAHPKWVDYMYSALLEHRLVAGALEIRRLNDPDLVASRNQVQVDSAAEWCGLPAIVSANMGVERTLWDSLSGFDQTVRGVHEDYDFSIRAHLFADVTRHFEPRAIMHYRYRSTFGSILKQWRGYGKGSVETYKKYSDYSSLDRYGVSPKEKLCPGYEYDLAYRAYKRILRSTVKLALGRTSRRERLKLAKDLGFRLGRLEGSAINGKLLL